jgi:hypothetical protein
MLSAHYNRRKKYLSFFIFENIFIFENNQLNLWMEGGNSSSAPAPAVMSGGGN